MAGPLAGIRVLDLSRFVAGPFCAMMLGDMGADVVKVEKPGAGEPTRGAPPKYRGGSLFAAVFNRNKRSLGLEVRNPAAQEIVRALAAEADVLVENFRPGTMEAMGCGWPALRAANPRLVMARISGYGQDGPRAARPCFDAVAQAESGMMSITGAGDGPPTLAGTTVIDHATGLHALVGVLAALQARHATGRGQMVDVALLDSALSMMMTAIPATALCGAPPVRQGNRDRYGAPANAFPCAGGESVFIVAGGDDRFARLAEAMGRPDLPLDPRFADNDSRLAHAGALEAEVAAWTGGMDAAEACDRLAAARVPAGKVSAMADVLANPQLRHRGQILEVESGEIDGAAVPMQGFVAKFSDTPQAARRGAPAPGAHSGEVLADWIGLDSAAVAGFAARGAFAAADGAAAA